MTAPRLLAIDPSLSGCAFKNEYRLWVVETKPSSPMTTRMLHLAQEMEDAINDDGCDLVAIEAPISHGASMMLVQLGGLAWMLRCRLAELGVPFVDIGNSQRSKWATGRGNAKKVEVLIAARERLGYDGHDDNEADATVIYDLATAAYGLPDAVLPGYKLETLAAIDWPEVGGNRPTWAAPPKPSKRKKAAA